MRKDASRLSAGRLPFCSRSYNTAYSLLLPQPTQHRSLILSRNLNRILPAMAFPRNDEEAQRRPIAGAVATLPKGFPFIGEGHVVRPMEDENVTNPSTSDEAAIAPPGIGLIQLPSPKGSSIYQTYFGSRYLRPCHDPDYRDFLNRKHVTNGSYYPKLLAIYYATSSNAS